jgi:hypothetical protein
LLVVLAVVLFRMVQTLALVVVVLVDTGQMFLDNHQELTQQQKQQWSA